MSGELQVVFIYDTLRCQKEKDDPSEAILYFHPEEISEGKRIAICGQLMGITHFLIDFFSAPKILTLENGKFALRTFGRQYVLALGCSSVTPDWLLEKQADFLYNLTRFFHKDIDSILQRSNGDRLLLSSKLTSIMEHYIPISQHHGDLFALTFGILPVLSLPKSANHISLSATVTLQTCMLRDGVLGGIVMFQNKVLRVELLQDVAEKLAFIQPYQLPPADAAEVKFRLPPGVQLLNVYIKRRDLETLSKHSSTFQYSSQLEANSKMNKENNSKGQIESIREEEPSDVSSSLGFSEPSTSTTSNPSSAEEFPFKRNIEADSGIDLKKEKDKWKFNIDSVDKIQRIRKTSKESERKLSETDNSSHVHKSDSSFLQPLRSCKSLQNLTAHQVDTDETILKKGSSLNDPYFPYIRCDGKSISKCLIDFYAYPNSQFNVDADDELKEHEKRKEYPRQKSIEEEIVNTPKKSLLISHCAEAKEFPSQKISPEKTEILMIELNKENETESSKILTFKPSPSSLRRPQNLALNTTSNARAKSRRRWSVYEDMMSPLMENPKPISEIETQYSREKSTSFSNFDSEFILKKLEKGELGDNSTAAVRTSLLQSFRKLSSPEDLSQSQNQSTTITSSTDCGKGNLTLTKDDNKNVQSLQFKKNANKSKLKAVEEDLENYENVLLFIYSLGEMRLLLLLKKECISNQEMIKSLYECGCSSIAELEVAVSNVEEQSMSMGTGHHDHYCYLHYEPVWRSLAHGGRNHSMDFDTVQHMHQDFHVYPNINELIIRGEDHVVYGYQCVGSEVFYQQSAQPQPGLPMPSDLMGKVPLKAKRRLERDHNILLL